jgi:hypothetical protein
VAFVKTRGKHEFAARTGTTYLLRPGEAS